MKLRKVYDELNIRLDELTKKIGSGSGTEVTVTPVITSGQKIATISVDDTPVDIFSPAVTPETVKGVEILDIEVGTNAADAVNTRLCDTEHVYAVAILLQQAPAVVNAITLDENDATMIARKDIYVDANHSATVIFFTLPEAISEVDYVDFPTVSASEKMGYCLFKFNFITADQIPTDQSDFQVTATKDNDGDIFTGVTQEGRDCTIAVVVDGNKYEYGKLEMADPETQAFMQGTSCNLKAKATTILTDAQQVYMNCNQAYAQGFCLTFDKVTT